MCLGTECGSKNQCQTKNTEKEVDDVASRVMVLV